MSADAADHDLAALAGAIARGETSARDAVARALARARAWQPSINAFVAIDDEGAMRRAAEADRLRASGAPLPPLHGVPVAIKDMFDRDGRAPGCGAGPGRSRAGLRDAALVEALARSGAIVVGQLNMTEYALGLTGHNDHVGDCRNPWSPDRVTGGSSSGPAAAVAARIVPASIGSDTGASIRIPAAWCGVAGLKPTHGLVDARGAMPMSFALDTIGPLATTMRGAAMLLDAIAALPRAAAHPACRGGRLDGLRVGVVRAHFGDGLDPEVERALISTIATLRGLGATIGEAPAAQADLARRLHRLMMAAEAATLHDRQLREDPGSFTAEVRYRLELGRRIPATAHLSAARGRARLLRAYLSEAFAGCDVLLTALVPRPAPEIERTRFGAPGFAPELLADIPRRTQPFNYLGLPALAMPCGFAGGLPVGCQIVGRPFDEATLLAVGEAHEAVTDWHRRIPDPPPGA
jgi:aspartyl-tRNA(Asn)/glutamyl-tRNA(Gln) amidotransferase subunit A